MILKKQDGQKNTEMEQKGKKVEPGWRYAANRTEL